MKSQFDYEGCLSIIRDASAQIDQVCQDFMNLCEDAANSLGDAGEAIGGDLGRRAVESYDNNVSTPYRDTFKPKLDSFTNGANQVVADYKTAYDEAAATLQAQG